MDHHLEPVEQVLKSLDSSFDGLEPDRAASRIAQYGKNKLDEAKKTTLLGRFIKQIADPMIIMLIAAALISAVVNEIADMVIIVLVVMLNAVLGVIQENKAERAIEALQRMSASSAKVRRGGKVLMVKTEDIVPGDIVLLEAGDAVPADMRLIESASLKAEEASLTGESVPVDKYTDTLTASSGEIPLGDRFNMAYQGTNIVYGRGAGVVTATGMNTEMGEIAKIISRTEDSKTPLQRKLSDLSKVLSFVVIGVCAVIFAVSLLRNGGFKGGHLLEVFMTAVSLAVAAIPEGLVAVVTVVLSIGVTKMSSRNAIIRKLTAVETLGCTQVICTDKTGTLTQNKMTVTDSYGDEDALAKAMCLCNDSRISEDSSDIGDPTELALVYFARERGLEKPDLEAVCPRVGEAPFDSARKMMSTIHSVKGGYVQYTKGAPDEILKRCSKILTPGGPVPLTREHIADILAQNKKMADKALRVLAAALREYDAVPGVTGPEAIEKDLTFVGLTGMIDPVRPEVKDAVDNCRQAGINVVMITGDHLDTAVAIGRELNIIEDESQAITGAGLSELSDEELEKRIDRFRVYARVQPEHKVRIVTAWRKRGMVTSMTGDGVNDAPALKAADIGIGMGITGTDVTKNVAEMVLADDNFATIVHAVDEGRRIFENVIKAIQFLLSSNMAEVVALFAATLLNIRLLWPVHLLWINLVTDSLPALALGMESAESDNMKKPPRSPKSGVFSGGVGINVIYQGLAIGALTLLSYLVGMHYSGADGTTMAFVTLSMCEIFHSLNMRSKDKSIFAMKTVNKYLLGSMVLAFLLTLGVIYTPVNVFFKLVPLPAGEFITAMLLSVAIIPLVEIVKFVAGKMRGRAR